MTVNHLPYYQDCSLTRILFMTWDEYSVYINNKLLPSFWNLWITSRIPGRKPFLTGVRGNVRKNIFANHLPYYEGGSLTRILFMTWDEYSVYINNKLLHSFWNLWITSRIPGRKPFLTGVRDNFRKNIFANHLPYYEDGSLTKIFCLG